MSQDDNKKISISLDISIPFDGSQSIQFAPPQAHPCREYPVSAIVHAPSGQSPIEPRRINCPLINHLDYPVKIVGSGNTGVICAFGDVTGLSPTPAKVKGYCFTGTPDNNPPGGSDESNVFINYWLLSSVPNAVAGVQNTLKIWYYDAYNTLVTTEERSFHGMASDKTFCEIFGGFKTSSNAIVTASHPIPHLPVVLVASARGFSEALGYLNGDWQLHLVPCMADCETIIWRTRESDRIRVELDYDRKSQVAALHFKHGGVIIRYSNQANWNPVNCCEFSDASCRAVPAGSSLPAMIQVKPGVAQ